MELFTSIQILIEYYVSKQWRHCSAASDLGLQWLPMSLKKDARLIWVEQYSAFCKKPTISDTIPIRLAPVHKTIFHQCVIS